MSEFTVAPSRAKHRGWVAGGHGAGAPLPTLQLPASDLGHMRRGRLRLCDSETRRRTRMDPARFEWRRMSLFAAHDFVGKTRWIVDRDGRRTYALVRGEGDCPAMLVHGGMAQ